MFDFQTAFQQITAKDGYGHSPFAWQTRLFSDFCEGAIPDALDLPTGLGKTSVIPIWLLARARGAPLPRRLIYVVDRRTVVDQATEYARRLRAFLASGAGASLREQLGLTGPLPISTLRGQFADNREWLSDPAGPAIVIGTVDMIGSRLLFQGYGVSPTMRPMPAGLLAWDSLLVLDEAHLSQPFQRMAEQLHAIAGSSALRLLTLSATQASHGIVFRLRPEETEEDTVRTRLDARKELLVEDRPNATAEEFAAEALTCLKRHPDTRILVYRESFDEASRIAEVLRKKTRKTGLEIGLLTGQRRGRERDRLASWLSGAGFVAGRAPDRPAPAVLVATSAGELGVDLDADHMLCDLVSWERMVQRLGRVNRRGTGTATVTVWDLGSAPGGEAEAERRRLTRTLLMRLPDEGWRRQAGPRALAAVNASSEAAEASTPPPLHPALTLPVVEAWAMTSLPDHAGRPEVGPWLRGWETEELPQSTLVWRRYLPVLKTREGVAVNAAHMRDYLATAPLRTSEKLETQSQKVLKWMKERGRHLARVRFARPDDQPPREQVAALVLERDGRVVHQLTFREWEAGAGRAWSRTERMVPGRTVLLHRAVAGLDEHGLLSSKVDERPETADLAPDEFQDATADFVTLAAGDEGLKLPDRSGQLAVFVTETGAAGDERAGFAIFRRRRSTEESENARSILRKPQTLTDHAQAVVRRVTEFADRLGLEPDLRTALLLAAKHHDVGKAATIWQRAAGAPEGGGPWAKTTGKGARWDVLQGYRHEFGSLVELEHEDLPEATRDLILHLVGAHHGRARPIIGHEGCLAGPPSQLAGVAGRAAHRYARLSREMGPWRLAWLEAILRAADQQASAAADQELGDG